ncbi:hypothetical protein NBRC116587_26060 [Pseudoteredinibacter isoporae]
MHMSRLILWQLNKPFQDWLSKAITRLLANTTSGRTVYNLDTLEITPNSKVLFRQFSIAL